MHLYIEGCESQFFRFNRSMTYWYTVLSPRVAIIANKYLCLKGVRKKFGILGLSTISFQQKYVGQTRIRPKILLKKYSLRTKRGSGLKLRPRGIHSKFYSLLHGKTYTILFEVVLRKKF